MKLFVKDRMDLAETEVEIRCRERDSEVENIIRSVQTAGDYLICEKENGDKSPVYISRILYFEAVERNVFAYTSDELYKIDCTLYDLEDKLSDRNFIRVSKSSVVSLKAVKSIYPESARRLKLLLTNGEWVIVSRNYVSDFRAGIGLKKN